MRFFTRSYSQAIKFSQIPEKAPNVKRFKISRFDPSNIAQKKPSFQEYVIDLDKCRPTVLDALIKIKTEQDSTITFRRSCREGICGSCAMNIDGVNKLACLNKIRPKGTTTILPLPHMYIIKDLVVDMSKFLEQHARTMPFLITNSEQTGEKMHLQSTKDRDLLDGHIECILCACCSTSCPEYWWHGHTKEPNDFLGPAALLNAHRWIEDSRDQGTEERLKMLTNYYSVYRCHQIMNCSSVCPKRLNPGRAISNLRRLLANFQKKKKADMEGMVAAEPMKACTKRDG